MKTEKTLGRVLLTGVLEKDNRTEAFHRQIFIQNSFSFLLGILVGIAWVLLR